jgi:hypothetical protein
MRLWVCHGTVADVIAMLTGLLRTAFLLMTVLGAEPTA